MEQECRRGRWKFCSSKSPNFLDGFSGVSRENYPDEAVVAYFWAENSDGIRVTRSPVLPDKFECSLAYWGAGFRLFFRISPIIVREYYAGDAGAKYLHQVLKDIEKKDDKKQTSIFLAHSMCWPGEMSEDDLVRFMADVQDPNLYRCLFECMPRSLTEGPGQIRERETLLRPIENLTFWQDIEELKLAAIRSKATSSGV